MRILVTGSRGTLGSQLCPALESAGHEVFGCDLAHSGADRYIRADVADYQQLQRAFVRAAPHVVIHLAAEFGRVNGEEYTQQLWRTNCIGTRNVIDLCLVWKAHLVFASSSEAYGDLGQYSPVCENDLLDKVPIFFNEYALSKWANEEQIDIAARRGLKTTVMRLFNIYGPGEHYTPYRSVVCRFIWQMLNGKTVRVSDGYRQLLYVDDWVDFVLRVVEKRPVDVFNVAGAEEVSMWALWNKIVCTGGGLKNILQEVSRYKETSTARRKRCSTEKAKNILGWEPVTPLDEGLRKTVEWMRCQSMSSCVPVPTRTATLSDGISTMPSSTAG